MYYESTRGNTASYTPAGAIQSGLAPDGGLFVPAQEVQFSAAQIQQLATLSYQERAVAILRPFLTDFSTEELTACVQAAYHSPKFLSERIAPIKKLNNRTHVLELFHGPTCAFKDMALQILPHLLVKSIQKTGETKEVVILVATSGDTGKAALEGFKDVAGTSVLVFYPIDGVSQIQKLQMVTQEGHNLMAHGVRGNFDDAQTGVKLIFGDIPYRQALADQGFTLSSANSINWGRLVPQIVYYFSAYADLLAQGEIRWGEAVNFVVPTGNFGNILAAYYAKQMGLPINQLICASNQNHVLTDFIRSGTYDKNRDFYITHSPSMDILISSNLERLLYHFTNRDGRKIEHWMEDLKQKGTFSTDAQTHEKMRRHFWADYATDTQALATIQSIWRDYAYVVDPHTAVAFHVYDQYVAQTGDYTKTIIVSTASPFKFTESVASAILDQKTPREHDAFSLLRELSRTLMLDIPPSLKDLDQKQIRHRGVCDIHQMPDIVSAFLR